jgi:hypothetical protein
MDKVTENVRRAAARCGSYAIALVKESRPGMIDLFACGWLMLVSGRMCVRL